MSSKLRIFPARRREAFGQGYARADGDAEDEIQRLRNHHPQQVGTACGRDPTSLGEPEPQSPYKKLRLMNLVCQLIRFFSKPYQLAGRSFDD
jgi:hypothetical protein